MRRTRMFPYPRIRPGVSIPGAAIESLPGGAVAVYDFVQGANAQTLYDKSGNNNNGTLGSTTGVDANDPTWTAQGLLFDGTEDYVQFTNAPAGTGPGETFTFLVPGPTGRVGEVATVYSQSQQSAGPTPYIWIYFTANAITLQLADGTARITLTFSTVAVGSLVTLTVDYASGRIRYYVNGTLATPITHTRSILPLVVGNARIGAYMPSLTHTASGTQSWLSRHSRALTDAEVAQAYRVIRRTLAARGVALP